MSIQVAYVLTQGEYLYLLRFNMTYVQCSSKKYVFTLCILTYVCMCACRCTLLKNSGMMMTLYRYMLYISKVLIPIGTSPSQYCLCNSGNSLHGAYYDVFDAFVQNQGGQCQQRTAQHFSFFLELLLSLLAIVCGIVDIPT